jgi:hypothetical protein
MAVHCAVDVLLKVGRRVTSNRMLLRDFHKISQNYRVTDDYDFRIIYVNFSLCAKNFYSNRLAKVVTFLIWTL